MRSTSKISQFDFGDCGPAHAPKSNRDPRGKQVSESIRISLGANFAMSLSPESVSGGAGRHPMRYQAAELRGYALAPVRQTLLTPN